eukprot:CAMPEP_0197623998 /NCGR_PEP_ID=MMETSP1338-20131121/3833_1 /TAXON_ID=43686 ORGANISM="Pelagodinium beii, Strain RCC1491" /NCGR_SAMPLE_ID=MMETSP1338 /ASSEMBLY_ACC=CAM_ASM_000754 /LENGTH=244 /DNA_ID=CAMNT_0043194093 /DNA_START=58 /DNA_END=792 /DNA_ORIENTATION=+
MSTFNCACTERSNSLADTLQIDHAALVDAQAQALYEAQYRKVFEAMTKEEQRELQHHEALARKQSADLKEMRSTAEAYENSKRQVKEAAQEYPALLRSGSSSGSSISQKKRQQQAEDREAEREAERRQQSQMEAERKEREREEKDAKERRSSIDAFLKKNGFTAVNAPKKSLLSGTVYALHKAAKAGDARMAQALLLEGADKAKKDSAGKTALEVAQKNNRKDSHKDVIKALTTTERAAAAGGA